MGGRGRPRVRPGLRTAAATLAIVAFLVTTAAAPVAAAKPPASPAASSDATPTPNPPAGPTRTPTPTATPAPTPTPKPPGAKATPALDPTAAPGFDLTVTLAGLGAGSVESDPAGIDCGTTCVATFVADATVTLTAAAADGSSFTGWTGACTGSADCQVSMSSAQSVTATFADVAPPTAQLSIDNGKAATEDPTLYLTIAATDNVPGPLTMQLGFGPTGSQITLGAPRPYASTATVQLGATAAYGSYTVMLQVADASANAGTAQAVITYAFANRTTMTLAPSYTLKAVLDYAAGRLTTVETVTITNGGVGSAIGYVNFSVLARAYGELVVGGPVTVNGQPVVPTYPNPAEMRVPLGMNLMPGKKATLVVPFVSTATTDVGDSLRARFSKVVDANGVVMMQISSWYPLLSSDHGLRNPGDSQFSVAAPVTLTLDAPSTISVSGVAKPLRIAAPGTVTAAPSSVAGRTITTVHLTGARELGFDASPRFVISSTLSNVTNALGHHIKVLTYYLSGESGAAATVYARAALDSLTAVYGAYPYDTFIVARSSRATSGNEYTGITFVGSSLLGSKYAVTHEVAHQWFYSLVGDDQLNAPWLDEGFAEFTGRLAIGMAMPSFCSTLPVDSSVYAFPNKAADSTCGGYIQTVYYESCAMLAGVRSRLGATAFAAALAEIVATYRGKVVTEANVVAILEKHSTNPAALDAYLYKGFLTH